MFLNVQGTWVPTCTFVYSIYIYMLRSLVFLVKVFLFLLLRKGSISYVMNYTSSHTHSSVNLFHEYLFPVSGQTIISRLSSGGEETGGGGGEAAV